MSEEGNLSVHELGAEVLARLAHERAEGTLEWKTERVVVMRFKLGRPEQLVGAGDRAALIAAVRAFAVASAGTYRFTRGSVAVAQSLGIDTLGEAWVAVVRQLPLDRLGAIVSARGGSAYEPTPLFDKLVGSVASLGPPARLARPRPGALLGELTAGAPEPALRAWAVMLLLGGLSPKDVASTAAAAPPALVTAAPASAPRPAAAPRNVDAKTAAVMQDIETRHARLATESHYEVLGIAPTASVEEVKKAYFALAKKWHSDSFAGLQLGAVAAKVEDIFRRVGEAHRVLADPGERKAYDFMMDRQSQGLPTEPAVILQAESNFRRAETLVRRGQAASALPLLEEAVKLNKGEAEFWVYLGFALYSAKGSAALEEAQAHIQKGLKLRDTLDVAQEFLGKIARVENQLDAAMKHFRRALEMNPKNKEAERELRLLSTRSTRGVPGPQSLGDLFKRMLKK